MRRVYSKSGLLGNVLWKREQKNKEADLKT